MGVLVYPVFERDVKLPPARTTGEFLGRYFETIDEIAERAGLTPLSAYGDTREVPDGFRGTPEELDELLGPSDAWFDARAGASNLTALAALIGSRPDVAARLRNPGDVIDELKDLAQQLSIAATAGSRFRLDLAY